MTLILISQWKIKNKEMKAKGKFQPVTRALRASVSSTFVHQFDRAHETRNLTVH